MTYDYAWDVLLGEEITLPDLDEDTVLFLQNFDAFEGIGYEVDGDSVLFFDKLCGDIVGECLLSDFLPRLLEYYDE